MRDALPILGLLLALLASLAPSRSAQAQAVYRCVAKDGAIAFQDRPCAGGSAERRIATSPRRTRSASSAHRHRRASATSRPVALDHRGGCAWPSRRRTSVVPTPGWFFIATAVARPRWRRHRRAAEKGNASPCIRSRCRAARPADACATWPATATNSTNARPPTSAISAATSAATTERSSGLPAAASPRAPAQSCGDAARTGHARAGRAGASASDSPCAVRNRSRGIRRAARPAVGRA